MSDRVVVVTGGLGVLGGAVAKAAIAAGCRVAVIDHAAAQAADSSAGGLVLQHVDLTDQNSAASAIDAVVAHFGRVDVLFNVAGGFVWQTVCEGDPAAWSKMHALNVMTALNTSRAVMPYFLATGRGRIVNVGANAAVRADAGMGAYAASKGGVHRLTESLAAECKGTGVTVNAVLPSIIDTPANRSDMPDADFGQWVTPDDLASVMLFLASDQAAAVTGALLPVTGGV